MTDMSQNGNDETNEVGGHLLVGRQSWVNSFRNALVGLRRKRRQQVAWS
jgi:hypothetical protein